MNKAESNMTIHTENLPQLFAWISGIIVFEIVFTLFWFIFQPA